MLKDAGLLLYAVVDPAATLSLAEIEPGDVDAVRYQDIAAVVRPVTALPAGALAGIDGPGQGAIDPALAQALQGYQQTNSAIFRGIPCCPCVSAQWPAMRGRSGAFSARPICR